MSTGTTHVHTKAQHRRKATESTTASTMMPTGNEGCGAVRERTEKFCWADNTFSLAHHTPSEPLPGPAPRGPGSTTPACPPPPPEMEDGGRRTPTPSLTNRGPVASRMASGKECAGARPVVDFHVAKDPVGGNVGTLTPENNCNNTV